MSFEKRVPLVSILVSASGSDLNNRGGTQDRSIQNEKILQIKNETLVIGIDIGGRNTTHELLTAVGSN